MPFQKVMLASPLKPGFDLEPGSLACEEKIDGIRIECEISSGVSNLFTDKLITPWSRYGIVHPLPTHILEALCRLPNSRIDGEVYVAGKRSYGAVELVNQQDLILCIFDIFEYDGDSTVDLTYDERRQILTHMLPEADAPVILNPSTNVNTMEEVYALRDAVWARDGEGLILKRRNAPYQIGKRSKDWIKIKQLRSAVLTVTGFLPSKGLINDRGPYAMIVLQDDDGNETTVKTRNDMECRLLEKEAIPGQRHPAIGRRLRIEYQERTMSDNNYRHPRFDRWETE